MGRVVLMLGIRGVGKSTLVNQLENRLEHLFDVLNYGEAMLQVGQRNGLLQAHESIMQVGKTVHTTLQHQTADYISRLSEERNVIIDTHSVIETSLGFMPGFPRTILERLSPELILVVEATPAEILERRRNDHKQRRQDATPDEIEQQQTLSLQLASVYAGITGAFLRVLPNPQGKIAEASSTLYHYLTCSEFECY